MRLVVGVGLVVWGLVRTDASAGADVPAGATVSVSPTAPLATLTPTTEPTVAPPTPLPSVTALPPTLPPAPTQPPAATVDPDCAQRTHNHLNIDKLAAQPTMADAVITELDDDSIRIIFEGVEVIVSGLGSSLAIRTNLANDRLASLTRSIDLFASEC